MIATFKHAAFSFEDEPAIHLITEYFQDAFRTCNPLELGYTWERKNPLTKGVALPDRRLDYMICPRNMAVMACKGIWNQPTPVYPSDHYGVMADLEC